MFNVVSPKSRLIVAASEGKHTTLWDVKKGTELQTLKVSDVLDIKPWIRSNESNASNSLGKRSRANGSDSDFIATVSGATLSVFSLRV
jgi:hypothetical protein